MAEKNKSALLRFAETVARIVYRVTTHGVEKLPVGGFLLLPNHVTWVDAIILQIACPRPIRFMVFEPIYKQPALNWFFRMIEAIPISPARARESIREAADRIRDGEIVCIFPEGELSRSGILLRLKRGYELIARAADAPIVPVWLDQLWGSIFSFYRGRFFRKIPRHIPYPVTVAFGDPLPANADIASVREELLALGERCYGERPILRGHLAEACVRGLKNRQFDTAIVDGMDHSTMSRGTVLAAGLAFAKYLREHCPNPRIALVLPPGRGAIVANLGVMLAGKIPVNLNFTAGRASLEAAIRIAQLEHVITAAPVVKRLADFPWPPHILYLEKILPELKPKIIRWRLLVLLLPWRLLAAIARIPQEGGHSEAVILFTSGSSGEPKGVVLSHRNLLANVSQFAAMLSLNRKDTVLASLPFFHSFGCTVTLWYPLIEGIRAVTYPNPLEVAKTAEIIERYSVTLFLSTPTFLRAYLRKAEPHQLAPIKLVVTGAEKLPSDVAEAFEKRFGKVVEQGYGLTETAPVASVNLPEPGGSAECGVRSAERKEPALSVQPSSRKGSVGKLAPGVAAQIRDPETDAKLSLHETGMLWLRGPNIFEGYLNDPKRTAEVIRDHWFKTGDLGRFDEDGFLFIEGRLSRFSKIGGEMVPHETVEANIYAALGITPEGERTFAISSIPDEAKGEALVLLSTIEIQPGDLRAKLAAAGIANLWIPKRICKVEAIPVLASGKLDLKHCKDLAAGS